MEYGNIVVEVGQVWYHRDIPDAKYQIVEIVSEQRTNVFGDTYTYIRAFAAKYVNGERMYARSGFGELTASGNPHYWNPGWKLDKKPLKFKKFSHVSQRALRKRMRDQMAARALTHRLTE